MRTWSPNGEMVLVADPSPMRGRLILDDGSADPPGLRAVRTKPGRVYVVNPWISAIFLIDDRTGIAAYDEEICPDGVMREWDGTWLRFVEAV